MKRSELVNKNNPLVVGETSRKRSSILQKKAEETAQNDYLYAITPLSSNGADYKSIRFNPIAPEGAPVSPGSGVRIVSREVYDAAMQERERQQREKEGSQIAETKAKLEAGKKHDWRNPGGENKEVDGEADSEISKRLESHKVTDPIEDFANSKKNQKKSWLSTEDFGDLFMERFGDSSENKKKVIDGQTFYNDYAMQMYLDNKKRYIIENGSRQNPLFSKFSSETAQKVADEDFKKHIGADITLHNVINGHKTVGATSPYFKYSLLTKDEKDTYNYLASFTEPKKVLEYLNLIDNDLEQRKAHEVAKKIDATGSTNLKTLAVATSGFASGLESIGKASMRLNGGSSTMMNRIAYDPSYGKMLSSALIENEDSAVRKFILNVVSTVSNQAPVLAYGLYTGGAAYGFALGSQVISDSIAEAVQNNKTIESGFVYGLAQTALELSLEKLFGGIASKISGKGTSSFVSKMMNKIDDVVGNKKVASMIKKALSLSETGAGEFLQEFTQAMTDPMLRNIIYNENNTYSTKTLTDALYQGLIGFFAGGVMAAPTVNASVSNVQYTKIGEMSNAKNVLKLCDDAGYQHSDSYYEVKNSVEKGKTVDNATLGRLSVEVTQAIYNNTHFTEEYMATVANLGTTEQIAELMFGGNTEAAVKFKEKYSSPTPQDENGESVFNISAKEGDKDAVTKSVENVTGNHSLTEDQKKIKEVGKSFGVNIEFKNLNETITITDPKTGKKKKIVIPVEGYYDEDTNTVVLNNSGHEALRPMEYIVKHELTHSIEVDEGTYALFAKEILGSKVFVDYVTSKNNPVTSEKFKNPEEFYQYLIDHYARMGKPLGEGVKALQKARSEAIANFVGDNLFSNNNDWATTLIEEMSTKARLSFVDWVKNVIEKLKMAFRGRLELTPIEEAERRFIEAAQKAKKYREKHDGVSKRNRNAAENKKTTTEKGDGVSWLIGKDVDGNYFADIREDIFDETNGESVARTIQRVISKRFDNLIKVNGQKIQINKTTNDEFRMSESARELMNDSPSYNDKLKTIANADEIIKVAKNWIGEKLNHPRKDDIIEFARGNVNYRVGNNGYTADVIVGIRANGAAVLYDLVNIYHKNIKEVPVTMADENHPQRRQGTSSKNSLPETTPVVKENVEKVNVEIDEKTESASPRSYSLASWEQSDYVKNRNTAAQELADALGITQKKAKDYIDSINSVAKVIADDRMRLDYVAAKGRSTFVSNAEYGGSVDCSTLCPKRKVLTGTFSAIQKALKNSALTAEEILDIRNRMKEKGLEVSCGLCYVEGSRAQMGKFSKEFIERYKKTNPEYVPDMFDINTPEGVEQLRIDHPEVYEAYEKFWNNKGVLNEGDSVLFASQQKPKLYQTRTDYKGEILNKFKSEGNVVEKNKNGGLRLQSFSDFEIVHLIDMMQVVMDMSRVGLAGQAYTKVPDFALALGNTGLKINLSLIAKGVDADGSLIFDDVEGMPIDTAMRIRDMYSDNVGTILVVFNDAQLKAALADNRVDFIIPFHRSKWKKALYEKLGLPKGTKDYTYQQNEKYIKPVYYTTRNGTIGKRKATNYMPLNDYWDFTKSGKENAEAYLKKCAEENKRPKFYKLLVDNKDGSYSLQPDGSTDGYWKLLIDFKMYNNDGVGVPQQPVKPEFNMDEALRMLDEYKGGHQQFPVDQETVDDFVKDYKAKHKMDDFVENEATESKAPDNPYKGFSYSLPDIDAQYLELAKDPVKNEGNAKYSLPKQDSQGRELSKGQQKYFKDSVVRDENGNLLVVYHGTREGGWTVPFGDTFWFSNRPELSETYSESKGKIKLPPKKPKLLRWTENNIGNDGQSGLYEVYLNLKNPLVVEGNGAQWSRIKFKDDDGVVREHKTRYIAEYAQDHGYDGVIFTDIIDSGYGEGTLGDISDVYVAFKSNQIKDVNNTEPTTSKDIRYSIPETSIYTNGTRVVASDRGNVGTVRGYNETTGLYTVSFKSKEGTTAAKQFAPSELSPLSSSNSGGRTKSTSTSSTATVDVDSVIESLARGEITEEEAKQMLKRGKIKNPIEIANLTEEDANTTPPLPEPKRKGDGDGESKLYGSLLESGIITDDVKTEIANDTYIKNYGTTTNKAELQAAAERLEQGGKEEVDSWRVRGENVSAVDVAEGIILLKQYQDAGDISGAIVIAERLREIASLSGQAVQAFSIIGRFTPEMMVAYVKHELSKARAKMVELKTEEWVEANKSRFELTDEEIRTITDNTILASELQDGSRTKAILLGEITTMLQNKLPPEKGQAMRAWMRTSLLFNVKTQLRNILGNATMVIPYIGSDFFGGLVDKAISTKTGVRTTGFDAKIFGKSFAQGMKKGAAETIDDYKRKIHTKQEELDRFETGRGGGKSFSEMHTGKLAKQLNAVARALNEVDRLNSMLLELGDRPFFESWFANELNTLMKLNKTDTPTKEMVEQAKQVALQRTWQDNNKVTKAASGLRKALNFASIGGYGLGDVVLKFVKTPANIAKAMFEFSPVGFAPALIKIKEMNSAIKRGKFTPAMQKEAVRSFSNAVVGTAIYLIGYALIAAGKLDLSGGGDDDKDVSNFEKYVLGVPPYSFDFFGSRVTYTWNQPLGTVVAVVAEIMDESKKGDLDEWDVISTVGEVFTSQSFLQNLYEFFSKDDALTGLANLALSEPSSGIPTLFSQIASLTDPYRRTSYESGNMWKSALNDVIYRLPVLRQLFLDKQVNTLGEENKNPQFLNPWFAFIDPSTQYPKSSSLVAQNIYELYEKTGDKTVMPRVAPYNVTIKGKTVNFSIEERNEIQRQMGTESAEILGKMFASAEFKKLSDNEKTKAVAKVYEYAYAKMKAELDIYDYETLSQMVGTNKNGDLILSKEKYNRLSNAARQMLVDEYFFGDEEIRCKGDPQKLSDLFIKKAKK